VIEAAIHELLHCTVGVEAGVGTGPDDHSAAVNRRRQNIHVDDDAAEEVI